MTSLNEINTYGTNYIIWDIGNTLLQYARAYKEAYSSYEKLEQILKPFLNPQKIYDCLWGWHGEMLNEVLPPSQILKKPSDIQNI